MEFTYTAYRRLIAMLKQNAYQFCGYFDYVEKEKSVIMRHDIDYCLEKSAKLARIEHEEGICSTYFVLLKTDFYNPASKHANDCLKEIKAMGHEIGLHFDETVYAGYDAEELPELIQKEADILADICGFPIRSFSMHRPNRLTLEKSLEIPGLVNAYGEKFFREFKYLSDSRKRWREPVEDIIGSGLHNRLHILTHAFWYSEIEDTIADSVRNYIHAAKMDRYFHFSENIQSLEEIVPYASIAE